MNEPTMAHVPSAEFRAMLEAEVVRTFRRQSQFAAGPRRLGASSGRGLLLVAIGLVLGVTANFAFAQVQEAQERNRALQAAMENRQLVAMRLDLATEALKAAQDRFDVGVITRDGLSAAESEVRDLRMWMMRANLDIAEIRATAAPPRDELWAPRVGDRDFVSDRLKLEAALYQDRLREMEQRLQRVEGSHRVGAVSPGALADAQAAAEDARHALELAGMKLQLRRQFLEGGLQSDELERRLQRFELLTGMQHTQNALRRAQERETLARERARIGAASQLDVKRAEVEVLELQMKLRSMAMQLQRLPAVKKEG